MKELKPSISYNVIITIRIIKYSKFFTVCAYRKAGPVNKFEEEKESNKKKDHVMHDRMIQRPISTQYIII